MFNHLDTQHMQAALVLAQQALYRSSPNPRVGAIIARGTEVLGRGATQAAGGAHAEVEALKDLQRQGHSAQGATVYVTLEPCAHFGRTPPCTQALIAAKPARVIAAVQDPNPLVAGKGLAQLQQAGIEVEVGLLAEAAQELNAGFFKRMRQGLPWLRVKAACSVDGITALPNGVSQWLTGEPARNDSHHFRAQACALLTGVGTVLADDPQLNVRAVQTPRQPLRVLVDSQLRAPLGAKIFADPNVLVFCGAAPSQRLQQFAQVGIQVLALPDASGQVDVTAMLRELARREINEVHTEAGYKLNGALIASGLVDELLIYLAPKLLGSGRGLAHLPELTSLPAANPTANAWHFHSTQAVGEDLRIRLRPAPTPGN